MVLKRSYVKRIQVGKRKWTSLASAFIGSGLKNSTKQHTNRSASEGWRTELWIESIDIDQIRYWSTIPYLVNNEKIEVIMYYILMFILLIIYSYVYYWPLYQNTIHHNLYDILHINCRFRFLKGEFGVLVCLASCPRQYATSGVCEGSGYCAHGLHSIIVFIDEEDSAQS